MGKISIVGKAEREIMYNEVELTINFFSRASTAAKAIEKVLEQVEKFLELVTAVGIDIKDIHIDDNNIHQPYCQDKVVMEANRELKIRSCFDMQFINALMDMIKEHNFSASRTKQIIGILCGRRRFSSIGSPFLEKTN